MIVVGVDEAGRGPLAGPVYAAAVVLGTGFDLSGLADSKQLTPARRELLAGKIRAGAQAWAVGSATVEEIDRLNILKATLLAMSRAVEALSLTPDEVLVDGNRAPPWVHKTRCIVGGDALEPAISAASILAKTARDAVMRELAVAHPGYGFERHAGYPVPAHLEALRRLGPSPAHRRTFAPVAQMLIPLQDNGAAGGGLPISQT